MTTLLLSPTLFAAEAAIVEDEAHHHLFKVKRHQVGDELRVVDGQGHARRAEIVAIDKRTARLALGESASPNEPRLRVEIFVAPPKPDRAAWLVEKATELGVVAVRFVSTERDARTLETAQLARLRRVAVSAMEQSCRSLLPEISDAGEMRDAVSRLTASATPIALLDGSGSHRRPETTSEERVALLVGPEGGWSPGEREFFGALPLVAWCLGGTVLRVETAAVVGAGLLLCGSGVSR